MDVNEFILALCNASKNITTLYDGDNSWYSSLPYCFLEDVVSNVIINTSDDLERKRIFNVIKEYFQKYNNNNDVKTLIGVGIIEPIYFTCGYSFFEKYQHMMSEELINMAKNLENYYNS